MKIYYTENKIILIILIAFLFFSKVQSEFVLYLIVMYTRMLTFGKVAMTIIEASENLTRCKKKINYVFSGHRRTGYVVIGGGGAETNNWPE